MNGLRTAALLCLLAPACSVETRSEPAPAPVVVADGTLVVDWTINGTTDPNQCNQGAVTTIDGGFVGEFQQACSAFATSINLAPGSYTASAVLVDARGTDRTTEIPIDAFTIRDNSELDVPIDFPASSFR